MAFKKKLYKYRPDRERARTESYRTKKRLRLESSDPASIERGLRQLLADKVSGNLLGVWLLVPEHLRLGTWDLLCQWTGQPGERVEPRLALQLVHEAALCVSGVRQARCLSQKGFELANGLPFVATDQAIHDLLDARTVADAERLQVALGLLRRARGHFVGDLLAIDPHRMRSYTKRQTCRYRGDETSRPFKVAQTFFCLDADTKQPVCFTTATSAASVTQATPGLLSLAADILNPRDGQTLVVADTEHYTAELIDHVHQDTPFDFLVPIPNHKDQQKRMRAIPSDAFTRRWAGLATAKLPYQLTNSHSGPHFQLIQRSAERPEEYAFKGFLTTGDRSEADDLTLQYPKRWHVEEFFNTDQALGWKRAGTTNLNIRYGQMTTGLIAQAAIHQFRQRLGEPYSSWDAKHLAHDVFKGIEADLRVWDDTIVVTFYNAPNADRLREHYEGLPEKLAAENVAPQIPWLYNFKLDFRFK
jgi:hypothetical protein